MFNYVQPQQPMSGLNYYSPPQQKQQQQQGSQMNPMQMMDMFKGGGAGATGGAGSSAELGSYGIGNPGAYGGSSASISGGGGMGGAGLAAIIAAIIVGQHEMSDSAKKSGRSYLGHESGDAFSGDFFSEPWESYGLEQLGIDEPSPGERTDAFFQTGDYGRGIASLPRTGARWFDPVGDFGYQYGKSQLGDWGGLIDPLRWGLDQLS